jgi:hypothetical protein
MATCTVSELLAPTACCDTYSQHDLLRIIAGAICQLLNTVDPMASCDFSQLSQDTAALVGRSQHEILRIIAGGICELIAAGGTGGQSCLLCGDVDPVASPSCTCATYYNKTAGSLWIWDADLVQWFALIG